MWLGRRPVEHSAADIGVVCNRRPSLPDGEGSERLTDPRAVIDHASATGGDGPTGPIPPADTPATQQGGRAAGEQVLPERTTGAATADKQRFHSRRAELPQRRPSPIPPARLRVIFAAYGAINLAKTIYTKLGQMFATDICGFNSCCKKRW